jgi:hypothetical protein
MKDKIIEFLVDLVIRFCDKHLPPEACGFEPVKVPVRNKHPWEQRK